VMQSTHIGIIDLTLALEAPYLQIPLQELIANGCELSKNKNYKNHLTGQESSAPDIMGFLVDQLECFFRHANASQQINTQDTPEQTPKALSAANTIEHARDGAMENMESAETTIRKAVNESLDRVAKMGFQCLCADKKYSSSSEEMHDVGEEMLRLLDRVVWSVRYCFAIDVLGYDETSPPPLKPAHV